MLEAMRVKYKLVIRRQKPKPGGDIEPGPKLWSSQSLGILGYCDLGEMT